jgi:hypothetical protein
MVVRRYRGRQALPGNLAGYTPGRRRCQSPLGPGECDSYVKFAESYVTKPSPNITKVPFMLGLDGEAITSTGSRGLSERQRATPPERPKGISDPEGIAASQR